MVGFAPSTVTVLFLAVLAGLTNVDGFLQQIAHSRCLLKRTNSACRNMRPRHALSLSPSLPFASPLISLPRRPRSSARLSTSTTSTSGGGEYGAEAITVLQGLEPVRKRPGMYIGSTGSKGLHHLVFEVVDNAVDEALAGHCTEIEVALRDNDTVLVRDNGRGIPCSVHPVTGVSSLETVLCVLHAGGKFGGEQSGYRVSGGLHGVGVSVVNALSECLTVEVVRNETFHSMSFSKGVPLTTLYTRPARQHTQRQEGINQEEEGIDHQQEGRQEQEQQQQQQQQQQQHREEEGEDQRGTTVIFQPDKEIFKAGTRFERSIIADRLDELAYLNAGLKIVLRDERSDDEHEKETNENTNIAAVTDKVDSKKREEVFLHSGGITELVASLSLGKAALHPEQEIITLREENKKHGIAVEVALRWSKDHYGESLSGFANGIRTMDGGAHLDGLKQAITKTLNAFAKKSGKLKEKDNTIPGEFLREGLTAVVSVKVPEPEFEGQTKTRLGNPEVRGVVDTIVSEGLSAVLDWHPSIGNEIVHKAMSAQSAALAAKAARDMVRRKSLLTSTVLPGKLADCTNSRSDKGETEIYIVEGDSAAGSAKLGRDRNFQAILPLRGKILNVEKAAPEKIYQNQELQNLISALGLGVKGAELNEAALRYDKIIIMTDADVDGAHIRLLLLTFLHRYQPQLIEKGHVFIACPPLFKITAKTKRKTLSGDNKSSAQAADDQDSSSLSSLSGENNDDTSSLSSPPVRETKSRSKRGEEENYFFDQAAFDEAVAQLQQRMAPDYTGELDAVTSFDVQRFKGLGEMMPQQLWDTTMDPVQRTLKKVCIEDAAQAERMFSLCMGDAVDVRKKFILENANGLQRSNLDY